MPGNSGLFGLHGSFCLESGQDTFHEQTDDGT
jgi:hypothetical protein